MGVGGGTKLHCSSLADQLSSAFAVKKWQKQFEGITWLALKGKKATFFSVLTPPERGKSRINKRRKSLIFIF